MVRCQRVALKKADTVGTARHGEAGRARQVGRKASDFWSQFSAAQPLLAFSFLWGVVCTAVFGLDLCTGWLFWRASVLMDVSFMLCGLGLILLCWDTYRDFR